MSVSMARKARDCECGAVWLGHYPSAQCKWHPGRYDANARVVSWTSDFDTLNEQQAVCGSGPPWSSLPASTVASTARSFHPSLASRAATLIFIVSSGPRGSKLASSCVVRVEIGGGVII